MISILMALDNNVDSFLDCIKTIFSQKTDKWELCVGVYGSATEESFSIISKYAGSKIRLFKFPGVSTRYVVLRELRRVSKFETLAFIDVSDIWHEDKLAFQVPYSFSHTIVGAGIELFGSKEGVLGVPSGDVPLDQIAPFSEQLYSSLLIQRRYAIFDLEKENPLRSLFENLRVNEGKYFGLSNALVYKKV